MNPPNPWAGAPLATLPAHRLTLQPHPAQAAPRGLTLSASLVAAGREDGPGLLLQYTARGPVDGLRLPEPVNEPVPADGLWRHTCFEAFVSAGDSPAYHEFNWSPCGRWAAYRFGAERTRDLAAEALAAPWQPDIALNLDAGTLVLQAWLPAGALPAGPGPLRWGLSAVIETQDGQITHWALSHPAPQPDFHHPAGRALALALPPFPAQP